MKKTSVKYNWVKRYISEREWNAYYKFNSSYCHLGLDGTGKTRKTAIGFLAVDYMPKDCELCTDEEIREIDISRRSNNVRPFPLKEV